MPTLNWIGKDAVVQHHRDVPYRLIHCNGRLSAGDPEAGNLIVEGDNLQALKALLPYYAGKVKCIYIDPPYNTGNTDVTRGGWRYNDNVDSPAMRKWLGQIVGDELQDLSRHDKWLCMMFPRLRLLCEFLAENGVIFISADDNEIYSLRLLANEIFGPRKWVGTIVWKNATDNNPTNIAVEHEYVICFARNKEALEPVWSTSTNWRRQNLYCSARRRGRCPRIPPDAGTDGVMAGPL